MIIDGTNLILGRMASYVAKQALLGRKIDILNCESVVITGKKATTLAEYRRRQKMGTFKGPFLYKRPDMFVKRVIRGMLPYKQDAGAKAFKNIKCHLSVPESFKDQKSITLEGANVSKMPNLRYIKIRDICSYLGVKI